MWYVIKKGAKNSLLFSLFLHALVLLDGLGGDGRCVLGAIRYLRIRRRGGDRAPRFARGHAKGEANRNYRYE